MAGQNKVTLTFAGDAGSLERTLQDVNRASAETSGHLGAVAEGGHKAGEGLKETAAAAKGTKEILRGAGDAAALLGGELGNTAIQAQFALTAARDLSKGFGELVGRIGLLRVGMIGLAVAAAALAVEGTKNEKGWGNVGQDIWKPLAAQLSLADDVVQKLPGHLGFLGNALDGATSAARVHAGASETDRQAMKDQEEQAMRTAAALAALHEQMLFHAPDTNPGGDATFTAADAQDIATQVYKDQSGATYQEYLDGLPKKLGGSVRSAGSSAKSAAQKAAEDLKQAQKTIAEAVRGLVSSFNPKFDMSTGATDGYSRVGDTRGASPGGLIANLKKQAADTIKLRKDLEKLARMGLDKGLLSTLIAGGLDSLPAAEDLLKGGKSEVGQANYYAGQINRNANTIATEQTARSLTKSDKQTLHINVAGGDADLVKLIRKWVRNNGGNVQGVLGT